MWTLIPKTQHLNTRFILLLFLLCSFLTATAQYHPENFTIYKPDNDLPTDRVLHIHQDQLGLMWLATNEGLLRYDGVDFDLFLEGEAAYWIYENKDGSLWVGTKENLFFHERNALVFQDFPLTPAQQELGLPYPVLEDDNGDVWVAFVRPLVEANSVELQRLSPSTKNWTKIAGGGNGQSLPDLPAISVLTDWFTMAEVALAEGPDGKIWLGGADGSGLYRYDLKGRSFSKTLLPVSPADSIHCNTVTAFHLDQSQQFWIGTYGGLFAYDQGKDQFIHYPDRRPDGDLPKNDTIWAINEDSKGHLWLSKKQQLYRFDPMEKVHYGPYHNNYDSPGTLTWISEKKDGSIVFRLSQSDRLGVYDPAKDAISEEYFPIDKDGEAYIGAAAMGKDDLLWLSPFSSVGLFKENPYRNNFLNFKEGDQSGFTDNGVVSILEDSDGMIWAGTASGLNVINPNSGLLQTIRELDAENILALHEDTQQRMWIGTYEKGIYSLDLKRSRSLWQNLALGRPATASSTENAKLTANMATDGNNNTRWGSLFQDQQWITIDLGERRAIGQIVLDWEPSYAKSYLIQVSDDNRNWETIYTQADGKGGVEKLKVKGVGRFLKLQAQERATHYGFSLWEIEAFGPQPALKQYQPAIDQASPSVVSTFISDRQEQIWFAGGIPALLGRYEEETDQWKIYSPDDPNALASIYLIEIDRQGRFWMTGYSPNSKPLIQFNPETEAWIYYRPQASDSTSLSSDGISRIFVDREGHLWIATDNGINLYQAESDNFQRLLPGVSIQFNENAFHQDRKGRIWLATENDGLYQLDADRGVVRHFTEEANGLPSQSLSSIMEDRNGLLWLGTKGGLGRFDPETGRCIAITKEQGLVNNRISRAYLDSKDNKIFLTHGEDGIQIMKGDRVYRDTLPPPVRLVDLWINNKKAILNPEGLNLPHDQNTLRFRFAAMSYSNPKGNQYAVRMDGVDDDWLTLGTKNVKDYNGLGPGRYTLRIKAANADGIWNETGIVLPIRILPPWYLSNWALLAYALLAALGIRRYIRQRMQAQQEEIARQQTQLAEKERALQRERELTDRLKQVDQLKDQFLANTSHELRTPLQGIIGITESVLDGTTGAITPETESNLEMVVASGKRLNSLVNDILDFSKLRNLDIELATKPVGLRGLVAVVLRNNEPLTKGKDLALVNEVDRDLPAVLADENRLQQILFNLVGNAVKFTEKGHVEVGAELLPKPRDRQLQIYVKDTGIGIPEDKMEAIFQEFEQGDGSSARQFAGTGLGLSISKKLVELHGGEMRVESTVGRGTTFFFTLPISTEQAPAISNASTRLDQPLARLASGSSASEAGRSKTATTATNAKNTFHILVVDDEPINQQVFKNHLTGGGGFRISQALNGEEAIQLLESGQDFDLVLLDVMMPRMSGYEVCQRIREKFLPSELPVIMVTAKNQVRDLVQGLSLGANDYLPKPFHKEELLARINTQLDLHHIFSVASKFVPNSFLHSLDRQRLTEVALGDHVQKEVTVLFSDIRGYTTLSEAMTPEENFNFVNVLHGRMGPAIHQHGGFINQYLGDAIMAIFPNSPHQALLAAIDMQKRLQTYNEDRATAGKVPIKMGIGLHTGDLIMGIIGDENRMDAATIADTVNTASRIESLTKHYGTSILLSQESLGKINEATGFHCRYLGQVQVKGKNEAVDLYECFDGDPPLLFQHKLESQSIFTKAMNQFRNRAFSKAADSFDRVLKINGEDLTARLFLNRARLHEAQGVPDDWTGVEVMSFK